MRRAAACFGLLCAAFAPSVPARGGAGEPPVYHVGVNSAWAANIREETMRRWALGTGATMPRVGMRMDLAARWPDHPDGWVRDFAGRGDTALAFLFNAEASHALPDGRTESGVKPPEGLWEPVFANGRDEPTPGAALNPKNEWAAFVGAMVERYDGDGRDDAPGSPRLTWFSVWNEPDWLPWPERPKSPDFKRFKNWWGRDMRDLARLVFVSRQAARHANPASRIGVQVCFPETLGFLLDDRTHPLAKSCDFVDFHAYAGPRSDDDVYRGDGLLPVLRSMQAEYRKRGLPLPAFACTETGVGGGAPGTPAARTQAAAAIKVQVAGAAAGLVTVCWYALTDPSWQDMGLVGDVSKLPEDGAGAVLKDAYDAMRTVAALLPPGARFVEELKVGEAARAYRFRDAAGRDLVVAWADDRAGADATATVALPLKPGRWERLEWDFSRAGRAAGSLVAGREPARLAVGAMPVFLRAETARGGER